MLDKDNAKLVNFLIWIETRRHHYAQVLETKKGRGFLLRGDTGEIRFYPDKKHFNLWEAARDPFDARMFRATAKGRKVIRDAGRWPEVAAAQLKRDPHIHTVRAPRDFKPGEA